MKKSMRVAIRTGENQNTDINAKIMKEKIVHYLDTYLYIPVSIGILLDMYLSKFLFVHKASGY